MTPDETRRWWRGLRDQVDLDARASKESTEAIIEISDQYRRLGPTQRDVIDQVVGEWLLSEDEGLRFDALALIAEHRIRSAVPALRQLAELLARDTGPGAPYELAKVHRTIRGLAESAG